MRELRVDNYIIQAPIIEVVRKLKLCLTNGKLQTIRDGSDNIVVTCPHHAGGHERTPACNIYVGSDEKIEYASYRCFVCGDEPGGKGSFVDFVSECFDCSKKAAKEWLIEHFGEEVGTAFNIPTLTKKTAKKKTYFNKAILENYASWHPYLASRGLTREICEYFQVKYDPQLRQIVFPCFDTKGNILMMPRRSIDYKTFYIDKDIDKPVYCLDHIIKNGYKKIVITEGPFDCLKGNQFGVPTVATFGQISDTQIEALNKSGVQVIYAMFDNDTAGKRFTANLKKRLSKGIWVIEVPIPNGKKDLGELTYEEFWDSLHKVMK